MGERTRSRIGTNEGVRTVRVFSANPKTADGFNTFIFRRDVARSLSKLAWTPVIDGSRNPIPEGIEIGDKSVRYAAGEKERLIEFVERSANAQKGPVENEDFGHFEITKVFATEVQCHAISARREIEAVSSAAEIAGSMVHFAGSPNEELKRKKSNKYFEYGLAKIRLSDGIYLVMGEVGIRVNKRPYYDQRVVAKFKADSEVTSLHGQTQIGESAFEQMYDNRFRLILQGVEMYYNTRSSIQAISTQAFKRLPKLSSIISVCNGVPCLAKLVLASVRRRMRDAVLSGLHALRGHKYCYLLNPHVGMGNRLITLANQYVWCGKEDLHLCWGLDDWLPEPFENLFQMTDAPNFRVSSVPITDWSRATCLPYPKGHCETWRFYVPVDRRSECEEGVIDCLYERTPEWAVKAYEPFFRQLRPSERVRTRIGQCAVTRGVVCVQVRNTNRKGEYANVSSIRQIVTVMRRFDPSQRFFVSAVDASYYREIEREFPGRVFGLPDKDYASMVDTVAEMWLLGQGKELICMGGSTFPEISWWWGNRLCRVTQLTKEYQCGR